MKFSEVFVNIIFKFVSASMFQSRVYADAIAKQSPTYCDYEDMDISWT